MAAPMAFTPTQVNSDVDPSDVLCKKLLQQLLKTQSVANFAATLDEPTPPRGVPIVGRRNLDTKDESVPQSFDQATLIALLRKLTKEQSSTSSGRLHSVSGLPEPSPTSPGSSMVRLDRSQSVSGIDEQTFLTLNKNLNAERFKTELCRQFQETGFCKYGAKCQFAHGPSDLRVVSRHQKYKTEMCRTYHTTGFCPYGTRCHFMHDEEEMKAFTKRQNVPRQNVPRRSSYRNHSLPSCGFNPAVGSTTDMSLGSVGDTPPSSISSSPAHSPTSFLFEDRHHSLPTPPSASVFVPPPPGFSAIPRSSTYSMPNVFNFQDMPMSSSSRQPLNINVDPVNSFAAGLQAALPKNENLVNDCLSDMFYMTPPLSAHGSDVEVCESPMEISRNLRLPVFSQISKD